MWSIRQWSCGRDRESDPASETNSWTCLNELYLQSDWRHTDSDNKETAEHLIISLSVRTTTSRSLTDVSQSSSIQAPTPPHTVPQVCSTSTQVTGQSAVSQWIMMWTSADITNPSATDDGSLKQSKTRVLTCLRQFSGCGLTAAAQHVITANNNIILLFTPSAAGCGLLGTRHHHAMIFNCCAARKDLISNKEPESR